jgi:RNA polymerase sigma-70 factor (ECF subfamily)
MLVEKEIIDGCKKLNHKAQKTLYEMYASLMRGICMRYISDTDEVKDVIQEGFLKIFGNINQFKGTGSFEGWMKRIMINTAITHCKSKWAEMKRFDDITEIQNQSVISECQIFETNEQASIMEDLRANNINEELIHKANFDHTELLGALEKLPDSFRVVFNLHCIENFKHEEIAEILEIEVNTSRSRLLRARNMMKKILYEMTEKKFAHN